VKQLNERRRAFGVNRIEQAAEVGYGLVLSPHEHLSGVARAFVNCHDLHDDESHTAFRAGALIRDQFLRGQTVPPEIRIMTGRYNPISDGNALD
jgi:hypothetical protein